jgi:hypothetical protein
MSRPEKGQCTVCRDPELCEAVDRLLGQKVVFREIARLTGVHRSIVGRHSLSHYARRQAEKIKAGKFDYRKDLVFTEWVGGTVTRQPVPHDFTGALRDTPAPNDVIVHVSFEAEVPPRPEKIEPTPEVPREPKTSA